MVQLSDINGAFLFYGNKQGLILFTFIYIHSIAYLI